MNCSKHPDREAAGICTYSGKSFCSEDLIEINGKMYGKDYLGEIIARSAPEKPGFGYYVGRFSKWIKKPLTPGEITARVVIVGALILVFVALYFTTKGIEKQQATAGNASTQQATAGKNGLIFMPFTAGNESAQQATVGNASVSDIVDRCLKSIASKDIPLDAISFHERYPNLEFEEESISTMFYERFPSLHKRVNISVVYDFMSRRLYKIDKSIL